MLFYFTQQGCVSQTYIAVVVSKFNDYLRNIEEYEISVVLKKSFKDFFAWFIVIVSLFFYKAHMKISLTRSNERVVQKKVKN